MTKGKLCAFAVFYLLLFPASAHAYLDPGTGSMLVSALLGIAATLFFVLKNFYYKIINLFYQLQGRSIPKSGGSIVFYSEGRQYWNTFKPVLKAMEARGQEAVYLASDADDPGLAREWKHVAARCIGMGNRGFAVLNMLEADICVMTTPGLDVLQIRRSPGVKHYCHLVHAPTDAAFYKLYAFDYFDSVMCSGQHQIKSLRHLEAARGRPAKRLFQTGCCYLDELAKGYEAGGGPVPAAPGEALRVLVAPTWGSNGLLGRFGAGLLRSLAKAGFSVTVRPHPQSFISEKELVEALQTELAAYPNLSWDKTPSPLEAMRRSDVLISDFSGVVFDYALILERPVITLAFEPDLRGKDAADLPWPAWELEVLPRLGAHIKPEEVARLPELIAALPKGEAFAADMRALREESLYNFRRSGEFAAGQLMALHGEILAARRENYAAAPVGA